MKNTADELIEMAGLARLRRKQIIAAAVAAADERYSLELHSLNVTYGLAGFPLSEPWPRRPASPETAVAAATVESDDAMQISRKGAETRR